MKKLLVGVFFITAGVGFAVDLFLIDHPPLAHGWFWPLFLGVMAASVFAARIKGPRLALFAWLLMVITFRDCFQNCEYLRGFVPR